MLVNVGEQAADRMKAVRAAVGPDIGVGKHGSPPPPYPRAGVDERTGCGARRSWHRPRNQRGGRGKGEAATAGRRARARRTSTSTSTSVASVLTAACCTLLAARALGAGAAGGEQQDPEAAEEALLAWHRLSGGKVEASRIGRSPLAGAGQGLRTTRDVRKGERGRGRGTTKRHGAGRHTRRHWAHVFEHPWHGRASPCAAHAHAPCDGATRFLCMH